MSSFKSVFIAVFIGASLIIAALIINVQRPEVETAQPTPSLVRATGKCATCHRQETPGIVVEYEASRHAEEGTNCLDCHQPQENQESFDHRGFVLARQVTAKNCQSCHATQYREFLRSRHAAPAYAAVLGSEPFTEEQIAFAETYHEGAVKRPPNALAQLEGEAAIASGCITCHAIGKPHADGSIGTCTACHGRHRASVALAREPTTCGACHMGPDHSQLEIFSESKHGVLFAMLKAEMNMDADPRQLTVQDMPVPTCATCHMSGLEGRNVTHDVTERLSYWLFAPISEKRPTYLQGQVEMKAICANCHSTSHTDRFFEEAEAVLRATNERVQEGLDLIAALHEEGVLSPEPFDEPLEFIAFDFWHYYGRTAKHGAFMGGADFVQWHGNYELLAKLVEMKEQAQELRERHGG